MHSKVEMAFWNSLPTSWVSSPATELSRDRGGIGEVLGLHTAHRRFGGAERKARKETGARMVNRRPSTAWLAGVGHLWRRPATWEVGSSHVGTWNAVKWLGMLVIVRRS